MDPPPIKATFDRSPEKLNQVWAYLGRYALAYPNEVSVVNGITANLKGEAAEWVTGLHDESL